MELYQVKASLGIKDNSDGQDGDSDEIETFETSKKYEEELIRMVKNRVHSINDQAPNIEFESEKQTFLNMLKALIEKET